MEDALATLVSLIMVKYWNEVPNLSVMHLDRPTHAFAVEEIKDEKSWYYDIKCFLQSQIYPSRASLKDKKTLRRLVGNFYLNGDILYKRNFDMVLLRCVDRHEATLLMTEVHEGSFGTHSNGHAMQRRCCEEISYVPAGVKEDMQAGLFQNATYKDKASDIGMPHIKTRLLILGVPAGAYMEDICCRIVSVDILIVMETGLCRIFPDVKPDVMTSCTQNIQYECLVFCDCTIGGNHWLIEDMASWRNLSGISTRFVYFPRRSLQLI
ncbi:hypothetical protein KIW84_032951 [Lathyrus oleraceus]|uniref:Uncharacterized protein n=1 Tax=Pisum sativum TaxID=3888 RepID=A0A9D4XYX0_PEA|nr:hypothetical protein KIW84_032951 [Pisum sativum]